MSLSRRSCRRAGPLHICAGSQLRATMATDPGDLNTAELLLSTATFRAFADGRLRAIWSQAKIVTLQGGEVLVRQNPPSDSVFVVVSGRFEVWVQGQPCAINEIGVGEPIGETGFFSGMLRTA